MALQGECFALGGRVLREPRYRGCETRLVEHLVSGSEGVFADDAADPVAALDGEGVEVSDRCWEGLEWRGLAEGAVWAVGVVVGLVVAQNPQQMLLVPDQCSVEEFASAAAYPAFHDRVRTGRPDGAAQDRDAGVAEHGVEGGAELGIAIAEQELDRLDVFVEVHHQVAGHLRDPCIVGVGGDTEDPDPAGGVLNDGEHIGAGAIEQINGEEVGGNDRLGLSVEELRPRRSGTTRCGWQACPGEDLPHRRRGHGNAESGMPSPASSPWMRR